jgi:A/G-specific adenine glycosylase
LNPSAPTLSRKPDFQRQLVAWYDRNRRDLPWRGQRDPYKVWLSEIMLQQTRVAVVTDYYRRFLQRFPSLQALAAARLSSVLAGWSGLGYYRRARMMHQTAREIVKHHSGSFPRTARELSDLPGIGRYTAAAVASIAFDEPVAVVDGNVERVLSRMYGKSFALKECWSMAQALLPHTRPGDFNQAMMELGATVCVPRNPHCSDCPVRKHCRSRSERERTARNPPRHKRALSYALFHNREGVWLVRRPKALPLMPGMWELPQLSSSAGPFSLLFTVRHSITVTDFAVSVFSASQCMPEAQVFALPRLRRLPLTGLARKILKRAAII